VAYTPNLAALAPGESTLAVVWAGPGPARARSRPGPPCGSLAHPAPVTHRSAAGLMRGLWESGLFDFTTSFSPQQNAADVRKYPRYWVFEVSAGRGNRRQDRELIALRWLDTW